MAKLYLMELTFKVFRFGKRKQFRRWVLVVIASGELDNVRTAGNVKLFF